MTEHVVEPLAQPPHAERPLSEIVVDLWENTQKLVHQEVTLARTEVDAKLDQAKKELGAAAMGAAVLYAGLLTLIAAAVFLLGTVIDLWVSALLIGAVVTVVGYLVLRNGPPQVSELKPERTISSVKK